MPIAITPLIKHTLLYLFLSITSRHADEKTFFLFLIISLFSCRYNNVKQRYSVPSNNDIDKVIETVIFVDSIPVLKKQKFKYPIAIELRKHVINKKHAVNNQSSFINDEDLNLPQWVQKNYFTAKDSSYLFFQNGVNKQYTINSSLQNKLETTSIELQNAKRKSGLSVAFYDFTIPIFSANGKFAYVEVTFNCSGLCGSAYGIILKKVKDKWTIVDKELLWIS